MSLEELPPEVLEMIFQGNMVTGALLSKNMRDKIYAAFNSVENRKLPKEYIFSKKELESLLHQYGCLFVHDMRLFPEFGEVRYYHQYPYEYQFGRGVEHTHYITRYIDHNGNIRSYSEYDLVESAEDSVIEWHDYEKEWYKTKIENEDILIPLVLAHELFSRRGLSKIIPDYVSMMMKEYLQHVLEKIDHMDYHEQCGWGTWCSPPIDFIEENRNPNWPSSRYLFLGLHPRANWINYEKYLYRMNDAHLTQSRHFFKKGVAFDNYADKHLRPKPEPGSDI